MDLYLQVLREYQSISFFPSAPGYSRRHTSLKFSKFQLLSSSG